MYDFVTLPADMRYKFAFDLAKWPEYFEWHSLPHDWSSSKKQNPEIKSLASKKQPKETNKMVHPQLNEDSTQSEYVQAESKFREKKNDYQVNGFIGVDDAASVAEYEG
jgi:hypothetical protein